MPRRGCVCGDTVPEAIDAQIHGALATGDLTRAELGEFVLHLAVYCAWPKASQAESSLWLEAMRLAEEHGEELVPWPELSSEPLGLSMRPPRFQTSPKTRSRYACP